MRTPTKAIWEEITELRMLRNRAKDLRKRIGYRRESDPDSEVYLSYKKAQKRCKLLTKNLIRHICDSREKLVTDDERKKLYDTIIGSAIERTRMAPTVAEIDRFLENGSINAIVEGLTIGGEYTKRFIMQGFFRNASSDFPHAYADLFINTNPWIRSIDNCNAALTGNIRDALAREYSSDFENGTEPSYIKSAAEWFTPERFLQHARTNPNQQVKDAVVYYDENSREAMQKRAVLAKMLETIPDSYPELYPVARTIKRHFYLHVGETNSGKTYDALNALMAGGGGIYLAPLRLLAYEKYVELNREGYPCHLITGEEAEYVPGAAYQSSTVEMIDLNEYYPVTVIDEAQMLADPDRGGRWTTAILGAYSKEIHVCMAPEARNIVIRLIEECDDTYEIIEHSRNTKLVMDSGSFSFPKDVHEKDAIVVFTRQNVHAVAAHLKTKGFRVSIIYGNLPYDVRQEQARLFAEGSTDVVVCTDAIGMGINLPIKRIVFLEMIKFDGKSRRILTPAEAKQIAGRAGRFGLYDTGYYTTEHDGVSILKKLMAGSVPPINTAIIDFPPTLLSIDLKFSELLEKWVMMKKIEGYVTAFTERDIKYARKLEEKTDDKELVYKFVSIPFDERSTELYKLWKSMAYRHIEGGSITMEDITENVNFSQDSSLTELELQSKICDLLYQVLVKTSRDSELIATVNGYKQKCSHAIMKKLEDSEFQAKKCSACEKVLAWNYPFKMCQQCYEQIYL